ncbi:glycosyltransferase [Proteinivorax hydrogeniformans]|uniref:Glycosyltransferase n=1 Tax=Proteinivorax hydrogeniformans TaxID=1826727 RepID=A0AAU8HUX5_9FIRM
MKLSIAMMVKNEEKYLGECLESLRPIMESIDSEIIIVDTGSTDNTVEIAKKHTNKVYFHEWKDDFAYMRNKTIEYCKGEWILILDADEIVENCDGIIKFLESKESNKYNTGTITIKNITTGDTKNYFPILMIRLFRNNKELYYEGTIHEQPRFKKPVCEVDLSVFHYGYLSTDKELMEIKFKRNTQLLERELEKDPTNVYNLYQLSKSYGMYKDHKKALEFCLKAFEAAKRQKLDLSRRMYIYTNLALSYYLCKDYLNVEKITKEALKVRGGYFDLYFYQGKAQLSLMKYTEAINSFEKYLDVLDKYSNEKIKKDPTVAYRTLNRYEEVYLDLCTLYSKQGKRKKALNFLKKMTKQNIKELAIKPMIEFYIEQDDLDGLKIFYDNHIYNNCNLQRLFYNQLETLLTNKEQKQHIIEVFSEGEPSYALLNKVRRSLHDKEKLNYEELQSINDLDFNELPWFYGDVVYALLKDNYPIIKANERTLEVYIKYLLKNHKLFYKDALNYLQKNKSNMGINSCKVKKVLAHGLLTYAHDLISKKDFLLAWQAYIESGTSYLLNVYNSNVIGQERIYDFKTTEDQFMYYILMANRYKSKNQKLHVKNLRKALKIKPEMKKGIEIMLEEIKAKTPKVDDELENAKEELKQSINKLVEKGLLKEANKISDEYKKLAGDDIDYYSIKGVIAMLEGNFKMAEKMLKTGLEKGENFDLLYNLGYLYQYNNQKDLAIDCYKKALHNTQDNSKIEEAHNALVQLGVKESKDQLLQSFNQEDYKKDDGANLVASDEMEEYKKKFKSNIQALIEQGALKEANEILIEYEKIVGDDIDLYSFRGVIAMLENEFTKAEATFKEGLSRDKNSFDLLYNLAYLYQTLNKKELAIRYYRDALKNSSTESESIEVYNILTGLGVNESEKGLLEKELSSKEIIFAEKKLKEKYILC